MIIQNIITGKFVERPNRFTVTFQLGNKLENAHLRDPGRLKELLTPDADLLLRRALKLGNRKTKYDVIGVLKGDLWILINSGFHSDIAVDLIDSQIIDEFKGYSVLKREYTYGKSRIDFLLTDNNEEKMLVEVKGCTLVEDGLALFPDAPTLRGKKHVEELISAKSEGLNASILFLILCEDAVEFSPNFKMDPEFSASLEMAYKNGVNAVAYSFKNNLKKESLEITPLKRVKISFKNYH
ncbi:MULTISPECIES: DNA/RNA nuclease SfsA [Methanobacterium]|uniref:Sugar fermentation stimulation protein homolog n=1 Tax=Methanobacterium veterum TaxID=408577 RepID=A0A9E4ZVH5_9EURY|nr:MULTISPECIES: DNA/RNA nuclease SfsA [Methanobacterium]MCZ3365821.1 DNA/RNA nuclease SfsA [Methanobacterium veterum]MCZ3371286.1 DNA/RNA nuclease SfsA [Methanobacterium veterum]